MGSVPYVAAAVHVAGWTVAWPNGADIAPETLCRSEGREKSAACPPSRRRGPAGSRPRRGNGQAPDVNWAAGLSGVGAIGAPSPSMSPAEERARGTPVGNPPAPNQDRALFVYNANQP